MDNIEKPNYLPEISIEYMTELGILRAGNFDNVPVNAFGAYICSYFPMALSDGQIKIVEKSHRVYVGTTFYVNDYLGFRDFHPRITPQIRQKFFEYYQQGVEKVVETRYGFIPLKPEDKVFNSFEQMCWEIADFNRKYKQLIESLQNSAPFQSILDNARGSR